MRFRKGAALALGILLLFALLLAQDPEEEENGLPDEAGLEDPAPIPFTVFYLDKEKNLIRLDLHDKTSTVVAENVATFVADETNRRIAMAIPAEDEMLEEQGVAEIILYSAVDGSMEVLGSSYMGYGLHFAPRGRFLGVTSGLFGLTLYDLETGEKYDASDENLDSGSCRFLLPGRKTSETME
ncbi:MAG TPA: hypothetical protein PKL39_00635 [Bacillota bacterium]|nr:hypothetical protein [Bacillota bacterium]HPZ90225.1 hypothetical protein [Bacillota bacterium]HQE01615.1 hypothetical protein [Bacillota bacterium]